MDIERGTLVVVYWWDVLEQSGWTSILEIAKTSPPLIKTVGWVLSDDGFCIKLLMCVGGMDASYAIIPKGVIRNIEVIREDEIEVEEKEE